MADVQWAEPQTPLESIRWRVHRACEKSGRDAADVELIAVSKAFQADVVKEVYDEGQRLFGESRWQEAAEKIPLLPSDARWHFIGSVQRNKVRKLLPLFDVVHAMDSLRLLDFTASVAEELGLFPKVFVQVNLAGEASKGGYEEAQLRAEWSQILAVPRVEVLGLMCIPPAVAEAEQARPWFVKLRELRDELQQCGGVALPCLSMGMSSDFEVAIEEGATQVRVGSAIFGKRGYRVEGELGE